MALDLDSVGSETAPTEMQYTWKDTVLYALGIGARREELAYLYEGKGPKVYPTFAVVPSFLPMAECLSKTGGNLASVLHGGQAVRIHRPIPSEGTITTVARLDGIYDMKRMAQAIVKTKSTIDGELVFETESSILYLGEGGFDGAPPPKKDIPKPGDAKPSFQVSEATSQEQALLYRLSGDLNPLHADPAFAKLANFDAPILHGLCTYGHVCRAIINQCCDGDGDRVKYFSAQFRKPVWPGESIRTDGFQLDDTTIAAKAYAEDRPDAVITNCWAELSA